MSKSKSIYVRRESKEKPEIWSGTGCHNWDATSEVGVVETRKVAPSNYSKVHLFLSEMFIEYYGSIKIYFHQLDIKIRR
jgi:hypothetical protein